MNKIPAVLAFLAEHAEPWHAALVNEGSEIQVKAAPDGGEPVAGEYAGKKWKGFRGPDGKVWKDMRVPWNANDTPEYTDAPMKWDLAEHALGIGASGWNWKTLKSEWFYYDFDSVTNHAENNLTDAEMESIQRAVSDVPWVTVARSKSGKGLHLYVHVKGDLPAANHTEHAAMSGAVLDLLSAESGRDLRGSVDCLGYLSWVWHRDSGPQGFEVLKVGEPLAAEKLPEDWRTYMDVLTKKRSRRVVRKAVEGGVEREFDEVLDQTQRTPLDAEHRRLLTWFTEQGPKCDWKWAADLWMLQCHTVDLMRAHRELGLVGVFFTSSTGKELPDINCFMSPSPGGAWQVRRFGKGVGEHPYWNKDRSGWTRCDFSVPVTVEIAVRLNEGTVDEKDGLYHFQTLEQCLAASKILGFGIDREPLALYLPRVAQIQEKRGKVVLRFKREKGDKSIPGWVDVTKSGEQAPWFTKAVEYNAPKEEVEVPDEKVRALASEGRILGYSCRTKDSTWLDMQAAMAQQCLVGSGVNQQDALDAIAVATYNPWRLVVEPFKGEYPGDRKWNRRGAQFAYTPEKGPHPEWDAVLRHTGRGLDTAVSRDPWCKRHNIRTGGEYLLLWVACMFQDPASRLPYLFLYSAGQKTGKSSFHEGLGLLFKGKRGYAHIHKEMSKKASEHNGQMSGAVLCAIDEVNLNENPQAYALIKILTTNEDIAIREMHMDTRMERNTTHFIQTANSVSHCPLEMGDTRIMMIPVLDLPIEERRNKRGADEKGRPGILDALEAEGPAFTHTILNTEIPPSSDRYRVPAVETDLKRDQLEAAMTPLQVFLRDNTVAVPGAKLQWKEFVERFQATLETADRARWTAHRVRVEFPTTFPRGKSGGGGDVYVGNIAWSNDVPSPSAPFSLSESGRLVQ